LATGTQASCDSNQGAIVKVRSDCPCIVFLVEYNASLDDLALTQEQRHDYFAGPISFDIEFTVQMLDCSDEYVFSVPFDRTQFLANVVNTPEVIASNPDALAGSGVLR
jgi:hypothetical protein